MPDVVIRNINAVLHVASLIFPGAMSKYIQGTW